MFDEVVEVVVVSTNKEKRISKRMKEDFLEGLEDANADGGHELEGEPTVQHGVARLGNFGIARWVSTGEGLAKESENELLEWE